MDSRESILAEIAKQQAIITAASERYNTLMASYNAWKSQADAQSCSYSLKSKRQACEADKAQKYATANDRKASAGTEQLKISQAQQQISVLNNQLDALAEATKNLSEKGLSNEALIEAATGVRDAEKIRATAEAQDILKSSEVENEGKRNLMWLGIGFGGLVLIVVAIIVIRKLKALKSKKK